MYYIIIVLNVVWKYLGDKPTAVIGGVTCSPIPSLWIVQPVGSIFLTKFYFLRIQDVSLIKALVFPPM